VPPEGPQCTIHVVSGSDKTKGWPKAGRSSAPAFFKGFGITANVKALAMLGIRKYKSSNKNK